MDQLQLFKRIANNTAGVDLVIVDIPDNLLFQTNPKKMERF
jgi:hypothetical protein